MGNADERRSGRNNFLLTATIQVEGTSIPVRISNLSAHGALVVAKELPPVDAEVIFRCNGVRVQSWIAWAREGRGGVQFAEPVDPDKLAKRARISSAAIVKDTRGVDFRRPGFSGNQLTNDERKIVEEWNRRSSKRSRHEES